MNKIKILTLLTSTAIFLTACGSQTSTTANNAQNTSDSSSSQNKYSKIGDTLTFDKEAEITVKNAVFIDERNSYEDSQKTPPKKVLLVTYDVKNLKDNDIPIGSELSLYVNGKKAETYPIQLTFESLSSNRIKENATQAFAVNEDGALELEVQPSFTLKNDKKIIKLESIK